MTISDQIYRIDNDCEILLSLKKTKNFKQWIWTQLLEWIALNCKIRDLKHHSSGVLLSFSPTIAYRNRYWTTSQNLNLWNWSYAERKKDLTIEMVGTNMEESDSTYSCPKLVRLDGGDLVECITNRVQYQIQCQKISQCSVSYLPLSVKKC